MSPYRSKPRKDGGEGEGGGVLPNVLGEKWLQIVEEHGQRVTRRKGVGQGGRSGQTRDGRMRGRGKRLLRTARKTRDHRRRRRRDLLLRSFTPTTSARLRLGRTFGDSLPEDGSRSSLLGDAPAIGLCGFHGWCWIRGAPLHRQSFLES